MRCIRRAGKEPEKEQAVFQGAKLLVLTEGLASTGASRLVQERSSELGGDRAAEDKRQRLRHSGRQLQKGRGGGSPIGRQGVIMQGPSTCRRRRRRPSACRRSSFLREGTCTSLINDFAIPAATSS